MKRVKKSLIAVFVLFLVFAIPVVVFSQVPSNWTKRPGGTEQTLIDVAAFNSDTLFTLDEVGNISATFDGGNTWTGRNPQTGKEIKINAIRVNPNLNTIIAVGENNGLYRSEDMGETWLVLSGVQDATWDLIAITDDGDNYDASVVYAVGPKGTVLKSVNDGVDWEKKELNIGANQDLKYVSFLNVDTGFVANENGIIRTYDGGNSWKVVLTGSGIKGLISNKRTADLKKLADVVKSIGNNGGGIQTSTDYGATWTEDVFDTPCDLLATGGTIFDPTQCEDLQNGLLVYGGGGAAGKATFKYMLSGNTFKGILRPMWENVKLDGIPMAMRTIGTQTVIAEALSDSLGRFDLEIPASFSGNVEVVAMQAWDPDFCPAPLPSDPTTLEPIDECDDSELVLRIINPTPVALNYLTFSGNTWVAVGNGGVVLTRTDDDVDSDGMSDRWSKQNSRTNEDLFAAAPYMKGFHDKKKGFGAVGRLGTIITTQAPEFGIISPTENDTLCAGTEISINWSGGDAAWNVLIYVIDVNSWTTVAVVNSSTVNDGNEIWTIPSNLPAGSYQIYVQEVNYATWVYGDVFTVNHCPAESVCLEECANNILLNWNFNENATYGPMPLASTANWVRSWYKTKIINGGIHGESPDVGNVACNMADTVNIGMWGNQAIGESIEQVLAVPFSPAKKYAVSFSARWNPSFNRPYPVQFEFRASTAPLTSPGDGVLIGISDSITTPGQWVTLSLPDWTSPSSNSPTGTFSVLTVSSTNQSSALHPDSTSYGNIGAICITEVTTTGNLEFNSQSEGFNLGESYPNPFSKTTVIEYTLPHTEKVTIKVFDLYGREIKTLVDKVVQPGVHQIEWNASGLPAGIYLYRMQAGNFRDAKRTIFRE